MGDIVKVEYEGEYEDSRPKIPEGFISAPIGRLSDNRRVLFYSETFFTAHGMNKWELTSVLHRNDFGTLKDVYLIQRSDDR